MGSAHLDRDLTWNTTSFEPLCLSFVKTIWRSDKNMLSWGPPDLLLLFSSRNRKHKTNIHVSLNISGVSHKFILLF